MDYSALISQLLIIIFVLVAVVNIVTEVFKKIVYCENYMLNLFVVTVSILLTVTVFFAYWQIKQMAITWYILFAFVIVGIMVAYAAMFGFDKLLKYFEDIIGHIK